MGHLDTELKKRNPTLYRAARAEAMRQGISTIDWISDAIELKLSHTESSTCDIK
ncbi:MAG: hypothetical protein SVY53_12040 [Chloroflexota bacterium]|nr:hypothetical protein [Chloroflexota bacterium]